MFKIIILFIFVELFEAYWQRSDSLVGALGKGYHFYRKSIFLLLFMHLGYLYTLYISITFSLFNWAIMLILVLKTLDIIVKINLIEKLFVKYGNQPLYQKQRKLLKSHYSDDTMQIISLIRCYKKVLEQEIV